jgi:hypothetical protein
MGLQAKRWVLCRAWFFGYLTAPYQLHDFFLAVSKAYIWDWVLNKKKEFVIQGFHRGVNEIVALQGCYAAYIGS